MKLKYIVLGQVQDSFIPLQTFNNTGPEVIGLSGFSLPKVTVTVDPSLFTVIGPSGLPLTGSPTCNGHESSK